jgi:uncharacterized membrane protein YqjE
MDATTPTGEPGTEPSVKRLGGAALGLLQGHLELFGLEFKEEKSRTFRLFIYAALSLIFGLLVVIGLSAAIVIAAWETHRMLAIIGLCVLYAVGLAICVSRVVHLARQGEKLFHATLEELSRNRERLLP